MCYSRSLIEREGIIEQETRGETERQTNKGRDKNMEGGEIFPACGV